MSQHLERDPQLPQKLVPKLQVACIPEVNSEKDKQVPPDLSRQGLLVGRDEACFPMWSGNEGLLFKGHL